MERIKKVRPLQAKIKDNWDISILNNQRRGIISV